MSPPIGYSIKQYLRTMAKWMDQRHGKRPSITIHLAKHRRGRTWCTDIPKNTEQKTHCMDRKTTHGTLLAQQIFTPLRYNWQLILRVWRRSWNDDALPIKVRDIWGRARRAQEEGGCTRDEGEGIIRRPKTGETYARVYGEDSKI